MLLMLSDRLFASHYLHLHGPWQKELLLLSLGHLPNSVELLVTHQVVLHRWMLRRWSLISIVINCLRLMV